MNDKEPEYPTIDFDELQAVVREAPGIINTEWKSSWYWERDKGGVTTLAGWEQMLKDAEERLAGSRVQTARLEAFVPRVRRVAEYKKQCAVCEKWYEDHPEEDEVAAAVQEDEQ